jgi:hypothetical protein
MGQFTISGDTSGTLTLAAPAIAGTPTITFPTVTGNALASFHILLMENFCHILK